METRIVRWEVISASGLFPPLFDLPVRVPEVFKAFFFSLESQFPLDLGGMESHGSSKYSELKLVLDVEKGKIHCELTPSVMLNHFRNAKEDELPRMKNFGRLYEAAVKKVFPDLTVSDRVYRVHAWLHLGEGGKEVALRLLEERGKSALGLKGDEFERMTKEYTLRADLKGRDQNVSYMVQRSAIDDSHLYIEAAVQLFGGAQQTDLDANYDVLLRRFKEIRQELGLDA